MIRPIPDFPQPATRPVVQPELRTKSISKSPQSQTQTVAVQNNLTRAPKSTSLKTLIKEPENNPQPVIHESSKISTPFTAEDLKKWWDAYAGTLEKKAHLKNTMINVKPVLMDDFKFEVKLHNPAQQEEMINVSVDLLKYLRTQLKNDQIQMYTVIDTNIEKKTAYTPAEKFEFLNNINPALAKLMGEFDLSME